jgi:uncharacterized protein (TIGR03435 family)
MVKLRIPDLGSIILNRLLAVGVAAGLFVAFSQGTGGSFEVASIKPSNPNAVGLSITADTGRFLASNAPLKALITFAFDIPDNRLVDAPKFVDSARFDIIAKLPRKDVPIEQLRPMVQILLTDRFKLAFHRETRDFPFYALIVDKNGPKISATESTEGTSPAGMRNNGPGNWSATRASMAILANVLTRQTGVSVQDMTGLSGVYNFTLQWTPDRAPQPPLEGAAGTAVEGGSDGPSLLSAIRDQLGLKLELRKGPLPIIVVDQLQSQPIEN